MIHGHTSVGTLLFSKRLSAPGMLPLREKLISLSNHLDHDIYVDTLLGMHFAPEPQAPAVQGFLLFDFCRIFLFENSFQPDGPRINSVVRSLVDDYSISPVQDLADYSREQFHFFYPLETLEVLSLLWPHRRPGVLVTLDLSNPEIRTAQAFVHPECEQPRIETSGAACLSAGQAAPGLKDCFTGPNMRIDSSPELDDLVSPNVGIIRRESKFMGRLSLPMAITQMAAGSATTFSCGGRSTNMPAALRAARCEAIERFQVNFLNPEDSLVYGSYETLQNNAIDPQTLCFSVIHASPTQSVRYDKDLPIYWAPAWNPLSKRACLAPAQEIWFNTRLLPDENLCLMSSTNACAVGGSLEEASLFALFEAIERDAFLTTWYLRRPCAQLVPASIQSESFQLLWRRMQNIYPHYSILLFDVTTDVAVPVVLCAAVKQSGRGSQVVFSSACRLHADDAAFAAMKDLSGFLDPDSPNANDEARARKLLEHPEEVSTPEDHAALYSLPETFGRLQFLGFDARPQRTATEADQAAWIPRRSQYNLKLVVEEMVDRLSSLEINVYLKDLTHREFRRRHLYCVRAITPGLYPMWFGYYSIRFRMSDRLRRLSETLTGKPLDDVGQVNLELHPFD